MANIILSQSFIDANEISIQNLLGIQTKTKKLKEYIYKGIYRERDISI